MDLYWTSPRQLDAFIFNYLQPDHTFHEQVGETIDKICGFLKEQCFSGNRCINVIKTVKGGSSGKGTALKNGSDADLVVFLSHFKSFGDQKENRGEILVIIHQMLLKFQKNRAFKIIMSKPKINTDLQFSPRSLSFQFQSTVQSDSIQVDVLPAFDALGQRTMTSPNAQVYVNLIQTKDIGGEFSTCFTELQRDFVKRRPAKLKGVIRLVKHWYREHVRPHKRLLLSGEFLPPKYALELLIIYAWESINGGENFSTAEGFRTVMELIVRYSELWLFWTENYNFDHPQVGSFLKNKLREPRPMILDPADPTGNVAGNARWDLVANEAECCLQQICVRDITPWDVEPVKGVLVSVIPVNINCCTNNLTINPFLPIQRIKQKVEHLTRIPMSNYYLEWNGEELEENRTLSSYGIFFQPVKGFVITVIGLDGSSLQLNTNLDSEISTIKRQIEQHMKIPVQQQRLIFNKTILIDNKNLLDSGIFFDATLHLLMINKMKICVKKTDGQNRTLNVQRTDTVLSLKNKIESLERLRSDQYYLTFESRQLEDGRTLEYYGIKPHSDILINLRLRGGREVQLLNAEHHN